MISPQWAKWQLRPLLVIPRGFEWYSCRLRREDAPLPHPSAAHLQRALTEPGAAPRGCQARRWARGARERGDPAGARPSRVSSNQCPREKAVARARRT